MDHLNQETRLKSLSRMLKVIAEPKRLEIISLLLQGTHCNCELGGKLNMAPNLISHHLRVLHQAGLIETERDTQDARWIYYAINTAGLSLFLDELQGFLDISQIVHRSPYCKPERPCSQQEAVN